MRVRREAQESLGGQRPVPWAAHTGSGWRLHLALNTKPTDEGLADYEERSEERLGQESIMTEHCPDCPDSVLNLDYVPFNGCRVRSDITS